MDKKPIERLKPETLTALISEFAQRVVEPDSNYSNDQHTDMINLARLFAESPYFQAMVRSWAEEFKLDYDAFVPAFIYAFGLGFRARCAQEEADQLDKLGDESQS